MLIFYAACSAAFAAAIVGLVCFGPRDQSPEDPPHYDIDPHLVDIVRRGEGGFFHVGSDGL